MLLIDGLPLEDGEGPECECECNGAGVYLVELYAGLDEVTPCFYGRAYYRRCCCPAGEGKRPQDWEL